MTCRPSNLSALTETRIIRFRILLPLLSIALGSALFHWGDLQARSLVATTRGISEGMVDVAARARYLDYALNAPAWALLGDTRQRLWTPSTYWRGYDLYYLLVVALMWFLIGLALDKRHGARDGHFIPGNTTWNWILAWGCFVWGLFTWFSMFPAKPNFVSWKDYFSNLSGALASGGYGWWWYPLSFAWGLALAGC